MSKGEYIDGDDNLNHYRGLTVENAKDIIACGFIKEKTFIFSDCEVRFPTSIFLHVRNPNANPHFVRRCRFLVTVRRQHVPQHRQDLEGRHIQHG